MTSPTVIPIVIITVLERLLNPTSCIATSDSSTLENYGSTSYENICVNSIFESSIKCRCDDQTLGKANDAYCTVLPIDPKASERKEDYWKNFKTQPAVHQLTIKVRPMGLLTSIPTVALVHASELRSIEISHGNIDNVHPFAFANLSQLMKVRLSRNSILELSQFAFAHLPQLLDLSLDDNDISELRREVFVDLPNMKKLFLVNNNLSVLHDSAFQHLTNLLELEINGNNVYVITQQTFTGLDKLKRLDLSSNKLAMLGDHTFLELRSLQQLFLETNLIELATDLAFAGLERLQRLSLRHNNIQVLSDALLSPLTQLEYLDLRLNYLKTITFESIQPIMRKAKFLFLDENQFVCDCRLIWILKLKPIENITNEYIVPSLRNIYCEMDNADNIHDYSSEGPSEGDYYDNYDENFNITLITIALSELGCLSDENDLNKSTKSISDLKSSVSSKSQEYTFTSKSSCTTDRHGLLLILTLISIFSFMSWEDIKIFVIIY